MYLYRLDGNGYDTILVESEPVRDSRIRTRQFYNKDGAVVKVEDVSFVLVPKDGRVALKEVDTDSKDTVILPKQNGLVVLPGVLRNTRVRRLVVPWGVGMEFKDNACKDAAGLEEYISLSRNVKYGSEVFSSRVHRRSY